MLRILFIDADTDQVLYALTDVADIRFITAYEISFTHTNGNHSRCLFQSTERMEIIHKTNSRLKAVA